MKTMKLTSKVLRKLDPEDILYAEFATGGAMGDCGTARIFTIEQGELVFYLVRAYGDKATEADEATWAQIRNRLSSLAARGELVEEYAGFGNTAWKSPDITFTRDDDNASFVYEKDGETYRIPASVAGVYDHIVSKFAERDVSLEELEAYLNSSGHDYTEEERDFFSQYLKQCRRADQGQSWFDLTIRNDYMGAIAYIHHLDGTEYILNPEDRSDCCAALQKYRLRYVVEKIGWNRLNEFFADFVGGHKTGLFAGLGRLIEEPIEEIFTEVKTIKSNCTELGATSEQNLATLFTYQPVLVDFTPAAHSKIIAKIQTLSPRSLRSDASSIAFYLANYILQEDRWPLTDVLPVAAYIIKYLPLDDFNDTHADQLLWVAGEVINDAWKFLSEDEAKQKEYRDFVYNLYWPRIGSLWPIQNYDQFTFRDETTAKMFEDVLSFVICLSDLTERNANFEEYLRGYTPKKRYPHEMVRRKAFTESIKGLPARKQFDRIMAWESDIAWFYLAYPKGTEEAKVLLDEIFNKKGSKFAKLSGIATLESLIITPNTLGVGEYVLSYLDQHFDEMVELARSVEEELAHAPQESERTLEDLFIAMSRGVTEANEFPPLESISKKLLARGANEAKIKSALKYARRRRRTILFQRTTLEKLF